MARPYFNLVQQIFEQSVVDALSIYGIDVSLRSGDSFSNYNPRRIFLRESVLNKLEHDWTYSPDIRAKIAFNPTGTPSWDADAVRDIVRDYVKNEIRLETGRMEVDAERKILENLVEGEYFKEGGVKKLIENATAIVSPDSAKFNKLLGTKLKTENQDAYRKAVLDVMFAKTSDGLVSEIGKLDKVTGKVTRPKESTIDPVTGKLNVTSLKAGQTFIKGVVEILENPTRDAKVSSAYLRTAQQIKKDFDDYLESDPTAKRIVDEIKKDREVSLIDSSARARISANEQRLKTIYETTPLGGTSLSTKDRLIAEQSRLNSEVVASTTSSGIIAERRQYLFFGQGRATFSDAWESHPELKIKLEEYTEKLAKHSSNPVLRERYQNLVNYYSNKMASVLASSSDAFSFSFSGGAIVINDRLRGSYDKATEDFAQGLKFLDFSSEYNILRSRHLEVDIGNLKNLRSHLLNKGVLSVEETALLTNTELLLNRFVSHSQALSVVEGMKRLNPTDPRFIQLKADFLANINDYESDPAIRAQIIAAVNSNDRATLRKLINSGSGNTAYDLKHEKLYEDFYAHGASSEEIFTKLKSLGVSDEQLKGFVTWVNKRALDNEVIKGFVVRRQVETVIYAAQLMTDPKYLQKEVKRVITEEVKQRLTTKILTLFPYNDFISNSVGVLYEFSQQDKKIEWLKKEGWKKIVDKFKEQTENESLFKEIQKSLDSFKIAGVELKLDLYDFLKDTNGYLKDKIVFFAKNFLEKGLNKFFRRGVEKSFDFYTSIKKQLWSLKDYLLKSSASLLTKYGGALGARLAAVLLGAAIPVAGWIVTAVIAVLPILLKPLFGDVDILTMLKKALKFVCIIPAAIFLIFWLLMIVPITTLFANIWNSFWGSIWENFTTDNYEYSMTHDWNFGVNNQYEITFQLANGLVSTSGNLCLKEDGSSFYNTKNPDVVWNNLRKEDFQGLTTNVNCKIMCNAQKFMLTTYPGLNGYMNCNATGEGQALFNPNAPEDSEEAEAADAKFWCTYAVTKTYRDDFPEFKDDTRFAAVVDMDKWFNSKSGSIMGGSVFEKTDLQGCFDPSRVMPGAAVMMTKDPTCNMGFGNHAAVFLKFEGNRFYYVNSNSSSIKEFVETTSEGCSSNQIKLKNKIYKKKSGDTITFYMCRMYQPITVPNVSDPNRCPVDCIPDKLNY